jgi:hypothetical protein
MRLPAPAVRTWMAGVLLPTYPPKRLTTSPRRVQPAALTMKAVYGRPPMLTPSSSILRTASEVPGAATVFARAPGWVYPSIVTVPLRVGRALAGWIRNQLAFVPG